MTEDQATKTAEPSGPVDAALGEHVSRGEFLTKATIGVGAVMGGLIAVPPVAMMLSPAVKGRESFRVPAYDDDRKPIVAADLPEETFTKFVLHFPDHLPGDGYVRDRVGFVRKNKADFKDGLTGEAAEFTLISNRCVHLGCPVQESAGQFVCPCHGGSYNSDGERDGGPPPRPLDRFSWEVGDDGVLYVTGEYSLTNDGKKLDKVYGPGQPTSGPQSLFYKFQP